MYSYTALGQLDSRRYHIDGQAYQQSYRYNATGQLVAVHYPSGRVVDYERHQGQLMAMRTRRPEPGNAVSVSGTSQTVAEHIRYTAFGSLAELRYGNDLHLRIERDRNARITGQTVTPAANDAVYQRHYNYDLAGNIVAIIDGLDAANSEQFGYDPLHRLVDAQGHYGHIRYGFDSVGNRQTRQINAPEEGSDVLETYRYDSGSNRLLAVDSTQDRRTLHYDATGNIVSDARQSDNRALIYGANNRLQRVNTDEINATYRYNAKGQRVSKHLHRADGSAETTHFHYDHQNQLIAETRANGAVIREYLYLGGQRIAMVEGERHPETKTESLDNPAVAQAQQLVFMHTDHLGTPKVMTDAAGQAVWQASSTPYGEMKLASLTQSENPLRFPGQYADAETGYAYNYFRDYDPSLGRYIQSDPIGLFDGLNTYAYVGSRPVVFIDPLGLHSLMLEAGADGIVGVGPRGSLGLWATTGGNKGTFDAGIISNGGAGSGFNPSAGFSLTYLKGGRENIQGLTQTTIADFGLSLESHINPLTGEWVGFSLGVDLTPIPGMSTTLNQSTTYSVRELYKQLFGESEPGKGGRYRIEKLYQCSAKN